MTHPTEGKRFTTSGRTINIDVRPDEARIIFFAARSATAGLWTADLDGRNAVQLPLGSGSMLTPRWKDPDGKSALYIANENGQPDVWEYNFDTRTKGAVTASPLEEETIDVATDGRTVVADTVEQIAHLWAIDPAGTSGPVQLTNDSRSDLWPSVAAVSGDVIFHRRKGSFVQFTPDDTELVRARWVNGALVPGEVLGPGAGSGISPDGRRVFFQRWPNVIVEPELWVKDLGSLDPAVRIAEKFWVLGSNIDTWAPLGQNATWTPRTADTLFFVRVQPPKGFEVVRATLAADLKSSPEVLASDPGDEQFSDLAVSDDAAWLAVVKANRRSYRGGTVQLLGPASSPSRRTSDLRGCRGCPALRQGLDSPRNRPCSSLVSPRSSEHDRSLGGRPSWTVSTSRRRTRRPRHDRAT